MYTITENAKFNSLEINFSEKPEKAVLSALKALKFRWNNAKKIWYGFCDRAELEKALSGEQLPEQGTEQAAEPTAGPNKELIKQYIDEVVAESWDNKESWRDYYKKRIDDVIEIQNKLIALDKPAIQKQFWVGEHGFDFDEKQKQAASLKSEAGFIYENMKQIDREKERLQLHYCEYYIRPAYNCSSDSRIYAIEAVNSVDVFEGKFKNPLAIKLTDADIQELLNAYDRQKDRFMKRLKTYLKRYGLSNVRASTYWADR